MAMKTIGRGVAVVALACAVALPAAAANIKARFGNTMLGTRPDGTVLKLFYNKDHSFSGEIKVPGHEGTFVTKGVWRLDGKNLCVTPEGPDGQKGAETCTLLKGDKVGDTWKTTVQGTDGKPVEQTVKIVKGR